MRPRYLAVLAAPSNSSVLAQAALWLRAWPGFSIVHQGKGLVIVSDSAVPLSVNAHGVVLGRVFRRGSSDAIACLDPGTADRIAASHGEALIGGYWGGYVAFLEGDKGPVALRAPLGDLPCYHVPIQGGLVLASDVGLLVAAGVLTPSIDDAALSRHLAAEDVRRSETCLSGLSELPGGDRMTVSAAGMTLQTLWTPWTFAASGRQIWDRGDAVSRVRDAAQHCVAASASGFSRVLLKLSGGLDSSVVAACLAHGQRAFDCVTLTTDNPAGDERDYAALVASHLEAPLIVEPRRLGDVMLEQSEAARLPRPTARSFAQASTKAMARIARETGAEAVIDGGGGDNIFCSLQSVRPIIDCLRDGENGCFWPTTRSIAELTQTGVPQVIWRTWRARLRGRSDFPFKVDLRFLSPKACAHAAGALDHPWLAAPDGALPGKAAHLSVVMTAQNVVEGFDVQDPLPTLSPLIAQPIVETCLQIPTWFWFAEGRNRAVAREAFAMHLPRRIIERRSKGSPDSFIIELYDANRPLIRAMLLGGMLAGRGLLDTAALAQAIDAPGPVTGHDFFRIMRLVDVEAWARSI